MPRPTACARQGRQFVYGFLLLRVPLDEGVEQKLAGLGVHLLSRHDDHHKARLPVGALPAVAALPEVEWVGVSAPEQKASPELAELRGARATAPAVDPATPIPIVVNLFEADEHGSFRRQLEAVGAALGEYDTDLHFYRAVATGPIIERIAALDFVLFIELIGLSHPGHDQSMSLVAPGTAVTSAKAGTYNEYKEDSGCSMATPHVTGLAATLMHHYPSIPAATPLNTYVLLACADGGNTVRETDETNNCASSGTTVTITPDRARWPRPSSHRHGERAEALSRSASWYNGSRS